jgi:hypothetical protein
LKLYSLKAPSCPANHLVKFAVVKEVNSRNFTPSCHQCDSRIDTDQYVSACYRCVPAIISCMDCTLLLNDDS